MVRVRQHSWIFESRGFSSDSPPQGKLTGWVKISSLENNEDEIAQVLDVIEMF